MKMTGAKYIVVGFEHIEKMIVFDPSIKHSTMAKAMKSEGYDKLVAAGFIDEFLQCYGESVTTFTKSRKEMDTLMLHSMLDIEDKTLTPYTISINGED